MLGGSLQLLFALHVLANPRRGVVDLQVGPLDHAPDTVQHQPNLAQLGLDRLQALALLTRRAIHLLIQHFDQLADVALGQHVVA
ncbi:MAG: hypothetical protein F4209_01155 [Chloroflexi bacterium]|nr:hypothetical protein [Chloroflexota bacterium]